jgi:hypothetical protein
MVRERRGEQLDAWLKTVETSHLQAFQTFMTGVQNDKEAVLAGLTLPWSTGPLEGHINRLKLIKRSMYGRAEFDLLKIRVLYQDKKWSREKEAEEEASRTTSTSSHKTEDEDRRHNRSIYRILDQQSCVRFRLWLKSSLDTIWLKRNI